MAGDADGDADADVKPVVIGFKKKRQRKKDDDDEVRNQEPGGGSHITIVSIYASHPAVPGSILGLAFSSFLDDVTTSQLTAMQCLKSELSE